MKKTILAAAAFCGAALLADTAITTNWNALELKRNAASPSRWAWNRFSSSKAHDGKVIVDKTLGKLVFHGISVNGRTEYYGLDFTQAKAGDVLQLKIAASGKGKIAVGYLAYTEKKVWHRVECPEKEIALNDKLQEYTIDVPVQNGMRGQITANIRLSFVMLPDSDVTVAQMEAVLKPAAK